MRSSAVLTGLLALAVLAPRPCRAQTEAGQDFVAGDRVLYADDFARTPLGMVPRAIQLLAGNLEVAEVDGKRTLRATGSETTFAIPLPGVLPERFTLEFDARGGSGWEQLLHFTGSVEGEHAYVMFDPYRGGVVDGERDFRSDNGNDDEAAWYHVAVMADANYVKVYSHGVRVANVPRVNIGRAARVVWALRAAQDAPVLVANVRIAAGGKDLYRALMEDGRMTLEGIEFDTNADRLRPASEPVLARAAAALAAHPDVSVEVQGHTDDVGDDAANQALSERRARAVVARLVALGVPAARLTAVGYGEREPVAPNDTPEGRQRNRRVELVRGS